MHSGFFFFLSFLQFVSHLINCLLFTHFFFLIFLHFLSLSRPLQSGGGCEVCGLGLREHGDLLLMPSRMRTLHLHQCALQQLLHKQTCALG